MVQIVADVILHHRHTCSDVHLYLFGQVRVVAHVCHCVCGLSADTAGVVTHVGGRLCEMACGISRCLFRLVVLVLKQDKIGCMTLLLSNLERTLSVDLNAPRLALAHSDSSHRSRQ